MPYMTIDLHPDNPHPAQSAMLHWYETEEDARLIALGRYHFIEGDELHLEPCNEFGDAWLKFHGAPSEELIKEFLQNYGMRKEDVDQIHIMRPGAHPGGNFTWINPTFDVMIPWIKERDDLPPHQKNRRHF